MTKGYKAYKKGKDWEERFLRENMEMRQHIFAKIKAVYDIDLALLEEAEEKYYKHVGIDSKKRTKITK